MPLTVNHVLTATTPDDPAFEIRPQAHWNNTHAVTFSPDGSEIIGAFDNGGNVTFGEAGGLITASAPAGGGGGSINFSAGTTSANTEAVTFGDGNGVSFGLDAGVITASHNAITTGALSNHSHGDPQLNLTNLSGTTDSNSAGFTLSLSNVAPRPGISAGTQLATTGTVVFSNSNGISFGLSGSTRMTASHNGLTTAAQSNHSHGNPQLNLTNLSGTTGSNSAGLTLSLSAAATGGLTQVHNSAHHSGTIFPQGVNQQMGGAFLQMATIAEPAAAPVNAMRLYVVDQNGHASMEVKGDGGLTRRLVRDSIIIAKVDVAGGVAAGQAVFISGATGANEQIQLARADNIDTMPAVGIALEAGANNAFIRVLFNGKATELNTSAYNVGDRLWVSAATAGALTDTAPAHPNIRQRIAIVTRAHATQGEVIVTPHIIRGDHEGTNQNIWKIGDAAAGSKSIGFFNVNTGFLAWNPTADRTLHLPDGNGTLLTTQSAQNVTAANGGFAFQTLSFSNANGVSFGTSAGSAITASHNALTTAAQSNHSHGNPQLALTNLSGTTASASNGLTLSLSSPPRFTRTRFDPFNEANLAAFGVLQGTFMLAPAWFPHLHFDRMVVPCNFSGPTNSTGSVTVSYGAGLYTRDDTMISLVHSTTHTFEIVHSGTDNSAVNVGPKMFTLPWTTTISESGYFFGQAFRTTTGGGALSFSHFANSQINSSHSGLFGEAGSISSNQRSLGLGRLVSSVTQPPDSIAFSQIHGISSAWNRPFAAYFQSSTA